MKNAAALLTLLPLVAAHGFVKSPPPRKPGNAFKAACGEQPFYQQSADINGNVQGIKQVVGSNFDAKDCNLWLCKGFQFDDNKDNVQSYKLGEKIDFDVNIAAPHTGYANVSVVKTSTDKMIGEPLIEFENYAANAGLNPNNTAFSVTLPESLGGECTKAGDCVLQWFWDAPDIDQTYESCPSSAASAAPVATSAPAAEKPATTLEAVAVTSSALGPVFESVTTAVPEPTAAAPDAGDDEDCDDEEPVDEGDDEDCDDEDEPTPSAAAETGDDEDCDEDEEPETGDDEECPADDGDEYDTQPATPSNTAQGISAAANTAAVTKTQNNAYPVPKPTGKSSSDKTGSGSKGSNNNAGSNNNYGNAGSNNNNAGSNTVVTSYVTVAAETHYVTVTADAPACTA
ncbi:Cellulose/chitin-binding protein, N-terminal [Fusarium oxysporum f. sp. vasinfectum]|nr:Cellulose/chitin-binding protein, N-terminal [Fusarium oxysporum f. sp. vasinfectum]